VDQLAVARAAYFVETPPTPYDKTAAPDLQGWDAMAFNEPGKPQVVAGGGRGASCRRGGASCRRGGASCRRGGDAQVPSMDAPWRGPPDGQVDLYRQPPQAVLPYSMQPASPQAGPAFGPDVFVSSFGGGRPRRGAVVEHVRFGGRRHAVVMLGRRKTIFVDGAPVALGSIRGRYERVT
jgi:hypothetical protein